MFSTYKFKRISGTYQIKGHEYDDQIKKMIPNLESYMIESIIRTLNRIILHHSPSDGTNSDEPRILLGITSDGKNVVYKESGIIGYYRVVPLDEMHQRVLEMVEKAKSDPPRRTRHKSLNHANPLLEDLVRLKPK